MSLSQIYLQTLISEFSAFKLHSGYLMPPYLILYQGTFACLRSSNLLSRKRCSENKYQIYGRTPMLKCDFNKVALRGNFSHIIYYLLHQYSVCWFLEQFSSNPVLIVFLIIHFVFIFSFFLFTCLIDYFLHRNITYFDASFVTQCAVTIYFFILVFFQYTKCK